MDGKVKRLETAEINEEEKGASMLEYALLAALIAVVCIAAITFLGRQASQAFSKVGGTLQSAG
jgi:pilus assembly protein Flp/PilA